MKKIIKILLFTFSFVAFISARFTKEDIEFYQIDTDQGLSNSNVTAISKGPQGFMWFGTFSGLNRYDGYNIKVYKHDRKDSTSLSNSWITDITTDAEGNLWVGTNNGINRYVPKYDHFKRYLSEYYVNSLSIITDKNNNRRLAACTYNGLAVYNEVQDSFKVYQSNEKDSTSIKSNRVLDIHTLKNGKTIVATSGRALQRFNIEEETFSVVIDHKDLPDSKYDKYLYQDSKGYLWIGSGEEGIVRYNPETKSIRDYTGGSGYGKNREQVSSDLIEVRNTIFIGAEGGGGLNLFDLESETFSVMLPDPKDQASISSTDVYDLYFDETNEILWVAAYSGGVNVYDPQRRKFKVVENNPYVPSSLSPKPVTSIFADSKERLWVGTDHGGLNLYQGPQEGFKHYRKENGENSLSSDAILDIEEAPNGDILLGTWGGGLNIIKNNSDKIKHYMHEPEDSTSIPANGIFDIHIDDKDRIWLTAWEKGIARYYYKKGKFKEISENDTLSPYLKAIGSDQYDDIWLAGQDAGIWIYQPDRQEAKSISAFTDDSLSMSINTVRQIILSDSNYIWICADKGLFKIDPETKNTIANYTKEDGLPSNSIMSIIEDEKGMFWIGTSRGISKFNPNTEEFKNFSLADGLQGYQFVGASVAKDSKGNLYFGGNKGYNKFHPDNIPMNKVIPVIVFTDFKIFNESVEFGSKEATLEYHINNTDEVTLNHTQNVFTFEFAALNYTNSHQNKYAYKLEGFDQGWKNVGTQKSATYTNIDPGEYIFKVKAANNDGVWNEEGRSINLTIVPPFWQTKWFLGLMGVLMISLVGGIIRYRTYVVRKRNKLLQEKVDKRTKKLQESLEELKIAKKEAEQAKERAQESDRLKSEFLANMSHEIRTPMNSIIGFAKVLKNDMEEEEKKEQLKIIYDSGKNLLDLINDILDLSKIEAGKMEISPVPFSLTDLINRFSKMFEKRAHKKDLYFDVEISEDVPDSVFGDDSRINQILINLAGNAIKFTKEGGVTVRCDYDLDSEEAILEIEDTGIGIPPEKQEKIFEPFRQADASTTREFGGTGLGLAISMKLIKMMEGNIELESEEGKGSKFTITLPLSKASASTKTERAKDEEKAIVGKKIGIVEDEPKDKMLLKKILEKNGFVPVHLNNSRDIAEEVIQKEIDLILMDLIMESPDGFELNRILKTDPRTAHLPVVVCSSSDRASETVYYGVLDYVKKPIQEDEILQRVYAALSVEKEVKNVFVIDDNKSLTRLYSSYLKDHDYRTFAFNRAENAIDEIEQGNLPDLIILDLMMPGMDGFEFLDNLRKNYDNGEIPVVVVTAKDLTMEEKQKLKNETMAVFQKGSKTEDKFISYINEYFDSSAQQGEQLMKNWLSNFTTKEEKRNFLESLVSLPEIMDKLSEAISERKEVSLKRYSKNLRRILENNNMKKMQKPTKRICTTINQQEIDWDKIILNFLELNEIYNTIPEKFLQGELPEQEKIKETEEQGGEKEEKETEEKDLNVLVAEDNPTNQKLVQVYFDRLNLNCEIAENGKKALEKIKANKFDVLFWDMQMPVMDGMETLERIKDNDAIETPYIVALTAHAMKGDEEKYLKAGCDEYMAKPLEFDELEKRMNAIKAQLNFI